MFLYFCLIYSYFLCSLLVERATLHWKLIQFALSNWIPSVSNQSTPEKAFDRCPHCYSLAVAGIAFAIRCRNDMDSFSWWNTRSESFVSHRPKATYTEMATSWRNSWTKVLEFVLPTISLHSTIHTIPFRQRRGGLRLLGTSHPKSWKEQFHSSGSAMVSPILFPFWWPEFGSKTAIGVGNFYPALFFWQNLDEVRTICWWKQPCQRYHSFFQRRFQVAFVRETSTVIEYSNMDVSENRGTPKWMVYNGKPY